jgi:hypothetical protein
MFTNNNRVKRRPSPYEMEISDGESAPVPCHWLEPSAEESTEAVR